MREYLENDGRRVWAARTPSAADVWQGCLAAVLNLDNSDVLPGSLLGAGKSLLLTRAAQRRTRGLRISLSGMENRLGSTSLLPVK